MTSTETYRIAVLVFLNMLSGTLLIPALRPFFSSFYPGETWAMHWFVSANVLGGIVGAPLFAAAADKHQRRRTYAGALAMLDGGLLLCCSTGLPVSLLLVVRFLQGACSVGALSILMGSAARGEGRHHGSPLGIVSGAVILAISVGAPFGTLCLSHGSVVPLVAGGLCGVLVGAMTALGPRFEETARTAQKIALSRAELFLVAVPSAFVAAERFAVGCFVVTFSIYAHEVLGCTDAKTGILYSCFLLPFAAATWPAGLAGNWIKRETLVVAGSLAYALCFAFLGHIPGSVVPVVLALTGVASAAIFSPALCLAASSVSSETRSTAMAVVNASGSLGMLLGTMTAGILSVVLLHAGHSQREVSTRLFELAALGQVAVVALALSRYRLRASTTEVVL